MKKNRRIKKWLVALTTSLCISVLTTSVSKAQAAGGGGSITYYLALIEQHTNDTLSAVNNLPAALQALVAMATAWTQADKSQTTANLQSAFGNVSNIIIQN